MSDKIKVLLVDDEPDMLDLFKDGLEDLSFDVTCAQNVQAAQNFLRSKTFQCLITDIAMPGLTGVDLVAGLRAEGNDIPVYFITGYADYPRVQLNTLKPKAVIFKPFDIEEASLLIKNHFLRKS